MCAYPSEAAHYLGTRSGSGTTYEPFAHFVTVPASQDSSNAAEMDAVSYHQIF